MADTTNGNGNGPFRLNLFPWLPIIVMVLGGAVAWGDLRTQQAAVNERVARLERRDESSTVTDAAMLQRLSSIEAKLETLIRNERDRRGFER